MKLIFSSYNLYKAQICKMLGDNHSQKLQQENLKVYRQEISNTKSLLIVPLRKSHYIWANVAVLRKNHYFSGKCGSFENKLTQ